MKNDKKLNTALNRRCIDIELKNKFQKVVNVRDMTVEDYNQLAWMQGKKVSKKES